MAAETAHRNGLAVPVMLQLHPTLAGVLTDGTGGRLAELVGQRLDQLLTTLGIPGGTVVTLGPQAPGLTTARPLRLSVHGQVCRYPPELLRVTWEHVHGEHLVAGADLLDRLAEDGERLPEVLALAGVEAVKLRPSVLLSEAQAAAWASAAAATSIPTADAPIPPWTPRRWVAVLPRRPRWPVPTRERGTRSRPWSPPSGLTWCSCTCRRPTCGP
jgi:hypothetical protein